MMPTKLQEEVLNILTSNDQGKGLKAEVEVVLAHYYANIKKKKKYNIIKAFVYHLWLCAEQPVHHLYGAIYLVIIE